MVVTKNAKYYTFSVLIFYADNITDILNTYVFFKAVIGVRTFMTFIIFFLLVVYITCQIINLFIKT